MKGFDSNYKDLPDYILKITYQIWENNDLEAIREDLSNKDKVDVESIAEVLIDRSIDLQEMKLALGQSDQGIDFNEPETFSECFTQNGKVSVLAIDKIIEGRMNLRQFCSSLHKQFKGCMHFVPSSI